MVPCEPVTRGNTMPAKSIKKTTRDRDGMHRILNAAIDEFCKAGLAGAKLDTIAKDADVSKQLIHHYFGTKSDLYIAVINEISAQEIIELGKIDYEKHSPDIAIRLFLERSYDFFVNWPMLAGLYNDQSLYGAEHIPECRDLVQQCPKILARLKLVIEKGKKQGIFRKDIDAEKSLAAAIMVTLGGVTQGPIISTIVPIDLSTDTNLQNWKEFAIEFSLNALRG